MSETASTRAIRSSHDRLSTTAPALLSSLVPLLSEWLPRQRWFAGKGRPITGFELVSATELLPCAAGGATPGLLHLLVRAQQSATPPGPRPRLHRGARPIRPPRRPGARRAGTATSCCSACTAPCRRSSPPP
ncbi:maltokinase N-terminal cap-like domain-containing protein [Streptomyces sp. Ac-502]|uniref:maltokinase N-terminal cap-like domain-containing protein n=1 Tax=Streptomyces sp. Ac-502 TaxID=3342801 RepID=UPI0038705B66